jgi:PTS system nitrogen regulatory IIA component
MSKQDDILTIRQVSEYLMVSEKTIYRMLEKGLLPGLRVGGQWRFRRRDMDSWIDRQVKRVEVDGDRRLLAELHHSEINLAPLIDEANVWLDVSQMSRDELLVWMIQQAQLDEGVDRYALSDAVLKREQICSTALVPNAAFPHPSDPVKFQFTRKRILIAVLKEPIQYSDPHGHQPRIVAMILARTVRGHLLALSRAIKIFGDSELVEQLTRCKSSAELIAEVRESEKRLANDQERAIR